MSLEQRKALLPGAHVDLHPLLAPVVQAHNLKPENLTVVIREENGRHLIGPRHEVLLSDGEHTGIWQVNSLRELFRGDKVPPSMPSEPPPDYISLFYFIEWQIVNFARVFGDKTDQDFEEAFSNLKRRPDGKPLSELQSFLWQVAACLLGTHVVSAAEYEAIFARLTRSASTFRIGPVSRNYVTTLRNYVA